MHTAIKDFEYILTFSSFYKAMYAKDKLQESGVYPALKRLPPELIRSCGQGLYIWEKDLQRSLSILIQNDIDTKGIFQIISSEGKKKFNRIR